MPVPAQLSITSLSTSTSLRSSNSGLSFINELLSKETARKGLQKSKPIPEDPIPEIATHPTKPALPGTGEITRCDRLTRESVDLLRDYGSIKQEMREEVLCPRNKILIHAIYCTIAGLRYSMHAATECHTLAHDIETWLERFPRPRARPMELGVGVRLKMLADRYTRRTARMADYFYRIFMEMDTIIEDYKATSNAYTAWEDQRQHLLLLSLSLKNCVGQCISFWSKASNHMFPIYVYAKRYPYSIISPSRSIRDSISNQVAHHTTRQEADLYESSQGCRAAYGTFDLYMFKMNAQLLDQFPKLFLEARKFRSYYTR